MAGPVENLAHQAEGRAGVSPWSELFSAWRDTNYDIAWNAHPDMPAALRAPLAWAESTDLGYGLSWDGAVEIYETYTTHALKGEELNFKLDPGRSAAIVDAVTNETGLDHNETYLFLSHLDSRASQTGNYSVIRPASYQKKATDTSTVGGLLSLTKFIPALLVVGVAAYAISSRRGGKFSKKVNRTVKSGARTAARGAKSAGRAALHAAEFFA